jgi:hypothetical protein
MCPPFPSWITQEPWGFLSLKDVVLPPGKVVLREKSWQAHKSIFSLCFLLYFFHNCCMALILKTDYAWWYASQASHLSSPRSCCCAGSQVISSGVRAHGGRKLTPLPTGLFLGSRGPSKSNWRQVRVFQWCFRERSFCPVRVIIAKYSLCQHWPRLCIIIWFFFLIPGDQAAPGRATQETGSEARDLRTFESFQFYLILLPWMQCPESPPSSVVQFPICFRMKDTTAKSQTLLDRMSRVMKTIEIQCFLHIKNVHSC